MDPQAVEVIQTTATPLANSLGIAALVPLLIEAAKKSQLPFLRWIQPGATLAARVLSLGAAAATAAGLVYRFEGDTLIITGITGSAALVFLWEMAKQFALQEMAYRAAVKPTTGGDQP